MKPNLKLDDVDIMVRGTAFFYLLTIALGTANSLSTGKLNGFAFDLALMDNTLVIQGRSRVSSLGTKKKSSTKLREHCYEAATIPVPGVKNSMHHYQLLRYNIGSLACLVTPRVQGTAQELPAARERPRPQETRDVHGIDVISTGQGVLAPLAFQGLFRPPGTGARSTLKMERERLFGRVPHLWVSRQTKLGVVDMIPPGQDTGPGGLTVVELGDRVMAFEKRNQEGLQRLVCLLKTLRDTVRAHGGPCVVVYPKKKGKLLPENRTMHVYSAGPEEIPVLLDWHKDHFWSKKNNSEENVQLQEKAINKDARPQKDFIGRWARWLGF